MATGRMIVTVYANDGQTILIKNYDRAEGRDIANRWANQGNRVTVQEDRGTDGVGNPEEWVVDNGPAEIETPNAEGTGYTIPAEFSDGVFEDFDTIRQSSMCNMMDRFCVAEAADAILDPGVDLVGICDDKKAYGRLLMAFSSWKQAQGE